jgi:hypothetical protein
MKLTKRNDKSNNIKDWTVKKLKATAIEYDDMIHGHYQCYGTKDIIFLDNLLEELHIRGYEFNNKLTFH